MAAGISNQRIDYLYDVGLKNGAYGGKLLGAGSGGYLLLFYSPRRRKQLMQALEEAGGEVMNVNFQPQGAEVWLGKNKF